jgi:hypothetical protein
MVYEIVVNIVCILTLVQVARQCRPFAAANPPCIRRQRDRDRFTNTIW